MATYTIYEKVGASVEIPLNFELLFHENNKDSALQGAMVNIIEAATALSAKDEEKDKIKKGIESTTISTGDNTPSDFHKPGNEYTIGHVTFSVPYFEALQYDFGSNVIDISLYMPEIKIGKTD